MEYIQNAGVPIGSCVAPILSEVFLHVTDETIKLLVNSFKVGVTNVMLTI